VTLTAGNFTIVAVCGIVGFGVVWFILLLRTRYFGQNDGKITNEDDEAGRSRQPSEWFQVLEVSQGAAIDEIRAAYRKKMMQYHPDRVEALGPEFKLLAEIRSREINRAYEAACRLRE
jgi:hypothetical protein